MNYFEQELRKLFDGDAVFDNARFVGRTCYGRLSDGIRVRVEFVEQWYADHYEALKLTLINRNEGVIDHTVLRFADVFGKRQVDNPNFREGVIPYIWRNSDKAGWYVYQPTPADLKQLAGIAGEYLDAFREPEMRQTDGMEPKMY